MSFKFSIAGGILYSRIWFMLFLMSISGLNLLRSQNYSVKKYTTKDGLLLNQTNKIFQDEKGFIWIVNENTKWQIFDDKTFTTIQNKGCSSYLFEHCGTNVYARTDYGYYVIHNYIPKYYALKDTSLFRVRINGNYSDWNPYIFSDEGVLYIIKRSLIRKSTPEGQITQNDTIYKIKEGILSKIVFTDKRADTSSTISFRKSNHNTVLIVSHNIHTYKCNGLYKIKDDKIERLPLNPEGEVGAIYTDRSNRDWVFSQNVKDLKHRASILLNGKLIKEFDLGQAEVLYSYRIKEDKAGNLWLPNISGLMMLNAGSPAPIEYIDGDRKIKAIPQVWYQFNIRSDVSYVCDPSYLTIALNSKDEVVVGNKIFNRNDGYRTIVDNAILGENTVARVLVDKEDNIWYSGLGLTKLTPTYLMDVPIRAFTDFLCKSRNSHFFSTYSNSKINMSIILAFDKKGSKMDSIIIPLVDNSRLNMIETGSGIVFIMYLPTTKEYILFNKKFKKLKFNKNNSDKSKPYEFIEFTDNDSNLIVLTKEKIYKQKSLEISDVTPSVSLPKFHNRSYQGHWRFPSHQFRGVFDSLGIYEYSDGKFYFTKLPELDQSSDYRYNTIMIETLNNPQKLLFFNTKNNNAFIYTSRKLSKLTLINSLNKNTEISQPSYYKWINDSIILCEGDGNYLIKIKFNEAKKRLLIDSIKFNENQFEFQYGFKAAGDKVFIRSEVDNIKFFYSDSVLHGKFKLYSILESSPKSGDRYATEQYDIVNRILYFKHHDRTNFIDLDDVKPNLNPPILNFLYITFGKKDSVIDDFNFNHLELEYNFNPLKIYYKGISTFYGSEVKYQYFLRGLDERWQKTTDDKIIYTSLPPGSYTLELISCNNDDVWNKTPAGFSFTILPPWYRTWYAYAGYFIFGSISIYMFTRSRTQKLEKEKLQLENIVKERTMEIVTQKHLIEEKHKEITDSINYAERIQRSFLATKQLLDENLKDHFVFFQPKDIVSGDFYWASKLSNGNFALVTADSTGHGVPGAIMSILNISCLENAVKEGFLEPSEILNYTRTNIIDRLKKDGSEQGGKDGMDASLICFDFKNTKLFYSAANNPIWIVRDNRIIELDPDKMPVGKHDRDSVPFQQHEFALLKNDLIYAITDGMPDQFGGPKGKKFMYKKLKELLISLVNLPMQDQKNSLKDALNKWKGDQEQVDDVCIIGIKI